MTRQFTKQRAHAWSRHVVEAVVVAAFVIPAMIWISNALDLPRSPPAPGRAPAAGGAPTEVVALAEPADPITPAEQVRAAPPMDSTAETAAQRRDRLLEALRGILSEFDVLPPTDDSETERLVQAIFASSLGLEPSDLPWLVEAFVAELVAIGPSAAAGERNVIEAMTAVRIFLGVVFQNLENSGFAATLGAELPALLLGELLAVFEELPADAQRMLAKAILDDRMLRGAWAEAELARLFELRPRPAALDQLLEAYSLDPHGAAFAARLARERELEEFGDDPKLIAIGVREQLAELGTPEYAKDLFEAASSEPVKQGVLEAVTQLGQPGVVLELARRNETDPHARLPEMEFRGSMLSMACDGTLTARDICGYLQTEPDSTHAILMNALLDDGDSWVPRWMLGFADERIPPELPRVQFSEESLALAAHRLVWLSLPASITEAEANAVRALLDVKSDRARMNAFGAFGGLARRKGSRHRDWVIDELRRIESNATLPDGTRALARAELREIEGAAAPASGGTGF